MYSTCTPHVATPHVATPHVLYSKINIIGHMHIRTWLAGWLAGGPAGRQAGRQAYTYIQVRDNISVHSYIYRFN